MIRSCRSQESHVDLALAVVHILSHWNACPWPELRAIDISGNSLAGRGIDQAIRIVDTIVVKCPRLEKVSVMGELCLIIFSEAYSIVCVCI